MSYEKTEKELVPAGDAYRLVPYGLGLPQMTLPEAGFEQPGVPLSHYVWMFRRHSWKIVAFVCASIAATLIVSNRITPIYESTATVDIDRQTPNGVVGQDS